MAASGSPNIGHKAREAPLIRNQLPSLVDTISRGYQYVQNVQAANAEGEFS